MGIFVYICNDVNTFDKPLNKYCIYMILAQFRRLVYTLRMQNPLGIEFRMEIISKVLTLRAF